METTIDVKGFSQRQVSVVYPYLQLLSMSNVTPLVVDSLPVGDLPLCAEHNGKIIILRRISESARVIRDLIKTHGTLQYVKSSTETTMVITVKDYLKARAC